MVKKRYRLKKEVKEKLLNIGFELMELVFMILLVKLIFMLYMLIY